MKRIISILFAVAFSLTALTICVFGATEVASGTCGKNLLWEITSDGTLIISGNGAMKDYGWPTNAPWDGYKSLIKSVIIEDGVTSIGDYAFRNCSSLTNINISDSVTFIGNYTFDGCLSLTNINVDDANPNYADIDGVFFDKTITKLIRYPEGKVNSTYTIPDSVTYIGYEAFYNCDNLTAISVPESVTTIREHAFANCDNIISITIPGSVTNLGSRAFDNCPSLEYLAIPVDVTGDYQFIPYLFGGSSYTTNNLYFPSNIKTLEITGGSNIQNYAFYSCENIEKIIIGESVKTIGSDAFRGCSSLKSIVIPNSLEKISSWAFGGCTALEEVHIKDISAWCEIDFATTYGNPLELADFLYVNNVKQTEVILPSGVSSISNSFHGYKNLISITIPESVSNINNSAFSGCDNLISINVDTDNQSFSSFQGCLYNKELSQLIKVPNNFSDKLQLPKSLVSINSGAFYGCNNLPYIEVDCDNNSYYSQNGVLYNKERTQIVCVPKKVTGVITIPNGITNINAYSFSDTLITSVEFPNSVTSISKGALEGCDNLTSITLPFTGGSLNDSATACFGYIFGASNYSENATYVPATLKSVKINQGSIAEYAFSDCSSIETLVLSDAVTAIGNKALYGCDNLQNLTVPFVGSGSVDKLNHHLASLFDKCLYGYYSLYGYYISTYTFPDTLKNVIVTGGDTIGSYAFAYCKTLESVTLPDTIETIGEYAFADCGLKEIIIPKSILDIGNNAFSGCYNINKTIYAGEINEWVKIDFSNTYSNPVVFSKNLYIENSLIEDVVLTDSFKINQYAFLNLKTLKSVSLSESILCIYDSAFAGCENLNSVRYEGTPDDWNGIEIKSGNEYLEKAPRSYNCIICCDRPKCNTETVKESTCIEEGKIKLTCENCSHSFELFTPVSQHVCGEDGLCVYCSLELFDCYLFSDLEGAICINGFSSFSNEMRPTELIIPKTYKGYTVIEVDGFRNCDKIKSVILPETIRTINYSAFYDCTSLTSINIPKGVTKIDSYAFYGCDKLSTVDLPSTITTIETYAFSGCTGLTSFSIPYSVTSLGDGALPSNTLSRVSVYNDDLNIYNLNLSSNVEICAAEGSKAHIYALDNSNAFIPHIHDLEPNGICSMCGLKRYLLGDSDENETVDKNDAIYLLYSVLFGDGAYPLNQSCDFNADGTVDKNDAIYLLYHALFGEVSYPLH